MSTYIDMTYLLRLTGPLYVQTSLLLSGGICLLLGFSCTSRNKKPCNDMSCPRKRLEMYLLIYYYATNEMFNTRYKNYLTKISSYSL